MKNLIQSEKLYKFIRVVKPWVTAVVIFLVLRYTGMLSAVTDLAGTTMMKTGVMDYEPDEVSKKEDFDFNFSIKDLNGNKVDFNQFKGKVVFLNMWATWCGPCRMEMPSIQSLYNSIDNKNKIVFVMLSIDRDTNLDKVVKYINDKSFTFPSYMPTGSLPAQLQQVNSIPTTFIIGADGKIDSKHVGAANYDTNKFKKRLEELSKAVI